MNFLRTLVSGKKKRFIDENYNLDLSYITPRIIAMAYPASGIQSVYRNKITTVIFLNKQIYRSLNFYKKNINRITMLLT